MIFNYVYEATFDYGDGREFRIRYSTMATNEYYARQNAWRFFKKYRWKSIPFNAKIKDVTLVKSWKA